MNTTSTPHIEVKNLCMRYGSHIVMDAVNVQVQRGEVMVIMGGSGCGKSTLLKYMLGLLEPEGGEGEVLYNGESFTRAGVRQREYMLHKIGVLYQGGALWSSMTLGENVALPLEEFTDLSEAEIAEVVSYKLSLVGLRGFERFMPSELSGGMQKRAGLARAMALDPDILFFDEPSAGLDPLTANRLDELILQLSDSLGTTIVVVTHELASIFKIADNAIFLDADTRTVLAQGRPQDLLDHSPHERVYSFLTRGGSRKV